MKEIIHNPHLGYRPDIDGLRALAILLVIIFHAFPHFLRGGFIGVDIFFVISGYLITSIILKGLTQGSFSLLEFYSHRIKRIFPSLIVVLSFCMLSGWYILLANEYQLLGKHIASGSIYISNFILESESGYFDTDTKYKPLLHLWSLSIEEQFYLAFPFVLITIFRFNINPFLSILLFLIISFIINVYSIENNTARVFYYPHTRAWELLIGSSVACINLHARYKFDSFFETILIYRIIDKKTQANLLAWFGFSLIMIAWINFDHEKILFPGFWALVPAIGTACLILAGEKAWLNQRVFSSKIAVFIGLISYPLYLWHWPLLSFTQIVQMQNPSSSLRFLVLVWSCILGWITYYFIEKNLRYREHWVTPIGLFVCLVLIGILGYQIELKKGYPDRFHFSNQLTEGIGLGSWETNGWIKQKNCLNRFGEYQFCLLQKNNQPITTMLIGDSHANHLYPGLIKNKYLKDGNLLNLGMGACLNFINSKSEVINNQGKHCQSFIDKSLKIALSTSSIKTIIIAGAWSGALNKKKGILRKLWDKSSSHPLGLNENDNVNNFQESMKETLQVLTNAHKKVIFVIDIPALGFNPSNCTKRPWRISGELIKTPCALLSADIYSKAQEYNQPIMKVLAEFPQVQIWNPTNAFCDKAYCWAMKEGKILYRDENHLNEAGSLYLGKYLKFTSYSKP